MKLQKVFFTNGLLLLAFLFGLVSSASAGLSANQKTLILAEQGNVMAQASLGSAYGLGRDGLSKDDIKSFYWFNKAAEQGHASSQYLTGFNYRDGSGVRKNHQMALYWLKRSSDQHYAPAQFSLGMMYSYGEGVRQNKSTAKEWFGKACDNGVQGGCEAYRRLNEQGY